MRDRAYRSDLTWGISFPNGDTYWLESASNFWLPAQVAGLAAAFAAPLASSLLVIESIERFDAPKTAITTLLAGVVAGGVASLIFPLQPLLTD